MRVTARIERSRSALASAGAIRNGALEGSRLTLMRDLHHRTGNVLAPRIRHDEGAPE